MRFLCSLVCVSAPPDVFEPAEDFLCMVPVRSRFMHAHTRRHSARRARAVRCGVWETQDAFCQCGKSVGSLACHA